MIKKIIHILIFAFFLPINIYSQQKDFEVIILHCNDIHASFDRYPQFVQAVNDFRAKNENVLLISDGDIFTGNPFVDKYSDPGFPIIDLMNYIKFDLSCIGNHEFDYGQETLNKRINQANFPFISSNIKNVSGNLIPVKPFYNFRFIDSIDICFLGSIETENGGIPSTHPSKIKGLEFENALENTADFTYLDNISECFIALNHLGIETDTIFARLYNQFDIIIGGHSHSVIDTTLIVNKTLITQTGSKLKNLGVIKLTFNNYKLTKIDNYLIDLEKYEISKKDTILEQKIKSFLSDSQLNSIVGYTETKIFGNDELGSFFTDAVRNYTKSDVAIQNNGGLRVDSISKGEIKQFQIYSLDPFGNFVNVVEMTANQLKTLITYSFKKSNDLDLQISGLTYEIIENSVSNTVEVKLFNNKNKEITNNKKFNVAMNTYIFDSYFNDSQYESSSEKYEKIIKKYEVSSAEMILEYLSIKKSVNYSGTKRTSLTKK